MRFLRTPLALFLTLVALGSCSGGDNPTNVREALVRVALQPALIPSPADPSALPINRIHTVVTRTSDAALLREQRFDVSPTATSWSLDLDVPAGPDPTTVIVYIYLLNVGTDGAEAVQFSGRTPPTSVTAGQRVAGLDADFVRGPLDNLSVTGVTIGPHPDTIAVGANVTLGATATVSGTATPEVFWTPLDPTVVAMAGAVASGVAPGTGRVVASAGAHADTTALVVVAQPSPVDSVRVSPDSADVQVGATRAYTAELRDASNNVLTGRSVTWTTGNAAVATVNATSGVVTGVAPGTTTVRATSEGVFDEAIVRVTAAPTGGGPLITWTRSGGGNWSDGTAWSLGRAPQPGDTVRITQGDDYMVTLDVDASVATLQIGGTTDVITLNMGDRSLTLTASKAGPELDVMPFGSVEIGNGTLTVEGITVTGVLRTTGAATIESDSIRSMGTWSAASGVQSVAPTTGTWFSLDGALDLGDGAVVQFGPNSVVRYGNAGVTAIQGIGTVLLLPGSTLDLRKDFVIDGPNVLLYAATILEQDSEEVTVGPESFLQLVAGAQPAESQARILVDGVLTVVGGGVLRSVEVRAAGAFVVQDEDSPTVVRTRQLDNYGGIVLVGTSEIAFGPGDTGQLLNHPGGVIDLLPGGSYILDGELINDGELYISGPTQLARTDPIGNDVSAQHVNNGLISLAAGSLDVLLAGPTPSSITNAGTIHLEAQTTLSVANATSPASQIISTSTAILEGDGTVDVRTGVPTGINNGTISPGSSPGVLTWLGAVPMGPTGRIAIEIEGAGEGDYDQLNASFNLILSGNGTLDVTAPSFTPIDGDRFPVLTFAQRVGTFGAVNLPTFPDVAFDTVWAEAGTVDTLWLVATATTPPPPNLNRWTGAVTGNNSWHVAGNWSKGAVPVAGDSVVIDLAGSPGVQMLAAATVAHLKVGRQGSDPTLGLAGSGHTLTVTGTLENSGTIMMVDNTTNAVPMVIDVQGGFTNLPQGEVSSWGLATDVPNLLAEVDNQGVLRTNGQPLIVGGVTSGVHVNSGAIQAEGGALTVDLAGGTLTNVGRLEVRGYTMTMQGGSLVNTVGGLIGGDGTLALSGSNFTNDGTVAPGFGAGALTIDGDYSLGATSSVQIDIGGLTPGLYDQVLGTGDVDVGGTLNVTMFGFTPTAGDRVPVMTFAARTGPFATVNLPTLSGLVVDTVWAEAGTVDTLFIAVSAEGGGPPNLNRWTGAVSSDWHAPGNWSKGAVPVSGDSVVIDVTGASVQISSDATIAALDVGPSGTFPTLALTGNGVDLLVLGPVRNAGIISFQDNAANAVPSVLTASGLTVTPGGIVVAQGTGDVPELLAPIDNQGTIWTQSQALSVPTASHPHLNSGLLMASGGDITVGLDIGGSFLNTGLLQVDAGRTITFLGGTLASQASGAITGSGTMVLSGTTFTNDAVIYPGIGPTTAILTIDGSTSYQTNSTLLFDLGGLTPGAYDQLVTTGSVSLDGALFVTATTFQPQDGDRVAIMTFASRTGTFANVQLPSLAGVALDTVWAEGGTVDTLYIEATAAPAGSNVWTWAAGDSIRERTGVYGTQGVPTSTNQPGSRRYAGSWTDGTNLFLFGGEGYSSVAGSAGLLNDVWRYDDGGEWTWLRGSSGLNQNGVYGTLGIASPANSPGGRQGAMLATDRNSGAVFLFGGLGYPASGTTTGRLNDLWAWTGADWVWIGGSQGLGEAGVYGTLGQPSPTNVPGARNDGQMWVDDSGDLWLFGGAGHDVNGDIGQLNDLWRWDGQWTWMGGSQTHSQQGVYGARGVAAPTNQPGARVYSTSWVDVVGDFWVFGGTGWGPVGAGQGVLHDLWRFDGTNWTWMAGTGALDQQGVYGAMGVPAPANVPGARDRPVSWVDASGDLWLFGGFGYALSGQGTLNDLWRYDGANWTWMGGTSSPNSLSVYGTQGTPDPANRPGARYGGATWTFGTEFFYFGGYGYGQSNFLGRFNDLWRYVP